MFKVIDKIKFSPNKNRMRILTNTSEVDFMFFNNGMLMEYNAIEIQQAGSNLLLKVDNNSSGYDWESGDEIVAFGKFNS